MDGSYRPGADFEARSAVTATDHAWLKFKVTLFAALVITALAGCAVGVMTMRIDRAEDDGDAVAGVLACEAHPGRIAVVDVIRGRNVVTCVEAK